MPHQVVVIGAGVIGLSSALLLLEAGHSVTIIARDFPAPFSTIDPLSQINYTSPWGGAHNRWVPPLSDGTHAREHALALTTFARMQVIAKEEPTAGVTLMKGVEYLEKPGEEYVTLTAERARDLGMAGFRLLKKEEFPDEEVQMGFEYDTYSLNPMVYCCWLLNRFTLKGGKIRKRELRDPREVFVLAAEDLGFGNGSKVAAVVNASGYGFGADPKMFVTRGQTVLVANECKVTVTRQNADGSWSFCVPRGFDGGTIIGGTKEVDNWGTEPLMAVREKLLSDFRKTFSAMLGEGEEYRVLSDIVGRRPTRHGGPRIEGEAVEGGFIMHAYGLGGRGYELSWGVAEEVVNGIAAL